MRDPAEGVNRPGRWFLDYEKPAARWLEALPLGNGLTGAMCFSGVGVDRVQLNDSTFWSGGPSVRDRLSRPVGNVGPDALRDVRESLLSGQLREAENALREFQGGHSESFLPLADLQVDLSIAGKRPVLAAVSDYHRTLDIGAGVLDSSYGFAGSRIGQSSWISSEANVLVNHTTIQGSGKLNASIALTAAIGTPVIHAHEGGLTLDVQAPSHVAPPQLETDSPFEYLPGDEQGMAASVCLVIDSDGRATSDGESIFVANASYLTIFLTTQTGYCGPNVLPETDSDTVRSVAVERVRQAHRRGVESLRAEHLEAHTAMMGRVDLSLSSTTLPAGDIRKRLKHSEGDPDLAALLFQYGRYLLVSSSRKGGLPANLQGIWNEHRRPIWCSAYTTNVNLQMNYWAAETTNLPETQEPYFAWLAALATNGHATARELYGIEGWVAHHNSDAWAWTAQTGRGQGDLYWAAWPLGGVWLSVQLWEHFLFSGNRGWLRHAAWPIMRGAAEFCEQWLIRTDDGLLGTAPSTSPENSFIAPDGEASGLSVSTASDIELIRMLLTACVEVCAVLDADAAFAERLSSIISALPALRVGDSGEILEWGREVQDADPLHRHQAHLVGVYPGSRNMDKETTVAQAAAASLRSRGDISTGWSLAWRTALWARLRNGERAQALITGLLTETDELEVRTAGAGVYPNLLCAHPPFQIDGNLGITAAIAEMLLQSHAGEIHVLPALPTQWRTGFISGLRARPGVTVDVNWRDSSATAVTLRADRVCTVTLRINDTRLQINLDPSHAFRWTDLD